MLQEALAIWTPQGDPWALRTADGLACSTPPQVERGFRARLGHRHLQDRRRRVDGRVRAACSGIRACWRGPRPARPTLGEAARATFARCGDECCSAASQLWQAVLDLRAAGPAAAGSSSSANGTGSSPPATPPPTRSPASRGELESLLRTVRTHSYEFLFTRRTLFGPRDLGVLAPLIIEASRLGIDRDHVQWLSSITGLEGLEYHPGYTLYVRTLGRFVLYRGNEEVPNREWQREKAKALFQLLLVSERATSTATRSSRPLAGPRFRRGIAPLQSRAQRHAERAGTRPSAATRSFTIHRDASSTPSTPVPASGPTPMSSRASPPRRVAAATDRLAPVTSSPRPEPLSRRLPPGVHV